jgi:uncharacterized membrane protein (DUF2068 family)
MLPTPTTARTSASRGKGKKDERSTFLMLIAAMKLLKGMLLILVGVGVMDLMHRDVQAVVTDWIGMLHLNPNGRFAHILLLRLSSLSDGKLEFFGCGMFFYSALFLIEGIGLATCRRWAEYMTIITTGVLLPLELYELFKKPTYVRVVVLLLNSAVVLYLIQRIRRLKAVSVDARLTTT